MCACVLAFMHVCSLLCPRSIEDVGPFVRVIELCFELRSEVSIGEVWLVVLLHEEDSTRTFGPLPLPPEPLIQITGNWGRGNSAMRMEMFPLYSYFSFKSKFEEAETKRSRRRKSRSIVKEGTDC